MANLPRAMMPHTVTAETKQSGGAYGDTYAAPASVRGWLDESRKLVRDATGTQVLSSSQFYTLLANQGSFTVGTKVTLPGERATVVIGYSRRDDGGMGAWQHLEVILQ